MDIRQKYRGKCGYCLVRPASGVHEIIPRSAGGQKIEPNQIPLCSACHDKIQSNWRAYVIPLHEAQARAKQMFGNEIEIGE